MINVKDSRWLQCEVCREFQRNKCTRSDDECKFAHPPAGVDVQNGRVVACYDSIKGRCNRDKPPCKYFHPPQHLKDQLLINGRNHLAFKNALLQQTVLTAGQLPLVRAGISANLLTSLRPQATLVQQFASQQQQQQQVVQQQQQQSAVAAVAAAQLQQQIHQQQQQVQQQVQQHQQAAAAVVAAAVHHHQQQQQQHQQQQQQQLQSNQSQSQQNNQTNHQQQQQRLQAQAATVAAAAAAAASLLNGNTATLTIPPTNNQVIKGPSNHYVTNLPIASPYGTFPASYGLTSSAAVAAAAAAEQLTTNFGIVPASALIGTNKTSRTDRLEVCREFQRGNCKRAESDCRFAHPPEHVHLDSDDGLITVCMDFVKSRCLRDQCRYFPPPPHLQAQLKAAQTRAHTSTALPNNTASAAISTSHVLAQAASTLAAGKKRVRETEDLFMTFPGVLPMTKRPALEKSGLPVFQPAAMVSAYQQALAMHQSFVPLAYKWSS